MTTQISPSTGAGVLLTQQGTGTTPGYSALDIRRLSSGALQEGVYGTATTVTAGGVSGVAAADFMVTQRAAGANLSVDINMPGGGMAFVQGDTIAGQGLYAVPVASSNINEAIAAADLTDPRVDQVILEVQDNVLDASGGNLARTRVLTGTPTAGATIDGRQGAAALPGSALLLADVLVPANATTVPNTAIRDRRKWARGAFKLATLTASQANGTGYAWLAVPGTDLTFRVECSGAPVGVVFQGVGRQDSTAGVVRYAVDRDASLSPIWTTFDVDTARPGDQASFSFDVIDTPPAGSHSYRAIWELVAGGVSNILAGSVMYVEEVVRQNTASNTVTTG